MSMPIAYNASGPGQGGPAFAATGTFFRSEQEAPDLKRAAVCAGETIAPIDFNRHGLSFRAVGSGIPVAALHGSVATAKQWASLSEYLGDDFRIVAPDMPGYGGSPAFLASDTVQNDADAICLAARRVSTLLQACRRPVHLVGHSAGGNVALFIAMSRPDLVASLTLIEPVAFHLLAAGDNADRQLYREIACLSGTVNAALADGNPHAGMARFIDFWNGNGAFARMPVHQRGKLAAQAGQVAADFAAAFAQSWTASELKTLAMPVRLIMGLESPAVTMRITERIAEAIGHESLTMIASAGHMMPTTHPREIGRIVERHVRRSEGIAVPMHAAKQAGISPVAA